eukprot:1876-Heterococcus_DN1.PRE.1
MRESLRAIRAITHTNQCYCSTSCDMKCSVATNMRLHYECASCRLQAKKVLTITSVWRRVAPVVAQPLLHSVYCSLGQLSTPLTYTATTTTTAATTAASAAAGSAATAAADAGTAAASAAAATQAVAVVSSATLMQQHQLLLLLLQLHRCC